MGTVIGWVRISLYFHIDLPAPQLPSLHLYVFPFPPVPHTHRLVNKVTAVKVRRGVYGKERSNCIY